MLVFLKKNKTFFKVLMMIAIVLMPAFAFYFMSAQKIKIVRAFSVGAQVDYIIPCLCSFGRIIGINRPVAGLPGAYMDDFLTQSYQYGNPLPSEWVLGDSLPIPTPCWELIPIPVPPFFTCLVIGFSEYRFVKIGNSGL